MLDSLTSALLFDIFNLDPTSAFGKALHFFVYDTIKIYILILLVVFAISFLKTYLNLPKLKTQLQKKTYGIGYIIAAIFGAVSPFCSCSSIPIFIGLIKGRLPLGIAFAFITTSPLVNEIVFIMMGGFFGWTFAFIYAGIGITLGVITGIIIDSLKLEREVIISEESKTREISDKHLPKTFDKKIQYAWKESKNTFRKLWWIILIGLGIGSIIHGYVPQEFFMNSIGKYDTLAVPLAVLAGIPIYAGCSTIVPIVFSITELGVPLGTALAFLMSVAGLSLPEAIILKRVISLKLLIWFFSIVGIGIILIGFIFNLLQEQFHFILV